MCRAAVRTSDWVTVSDAEATRTTWTTTREMLEELQGIVHATIGAAAAAGLMLTAVTD